MVGLRVAVIGAGASGLPAVKCCLDEALEPTCFERTDDIGGLWNFTEEAVEGQSCVMKSTITNSSKEMMCYSDFPIPKEYSPYMHNKYVKKYFHLYADTFGLKKYIKFKTEVIMVKKSADFKNTGKWDITYKSVSSSDTTTETFDAVLVCSGHHANKKMASWPGMEKFKGKVTHTHDYKDYHGYENKRVIVVGVGNSGCDVAIELSRMASQVFLSTRRGAWIVGRVGDNGAPDDMVSLTRFNLLLASLFPNYIDKMQQRKIEQRFDHAKYGLKPKHSINQQGPSISDDLHSRIVAGGVVVKGDIKEFTETGVIFEDATKEDIDAIVLATGYLIGFPFIDKEVIDVRDNRVELFKYMFPPDLEKYTLAVIGCCQPRGAFMPLFETECRLAARCFKGDVRLPSKDAMWKDIRHKEALLAQRYVKSTRHTIQVDYVQFMDELAELNGHKPNLHPKLAWEVFFGPTTPYQYRLMGPGAWKGAREYIMCQWDRTYYPLNTRKCDVPEEESHTGFVYVIVMVILAMIVYYIFC